LNRSLDVQPPRLGMETTIALFSCFNVGTIQWATTLDKHKMRTYVLERLRITLCMVTYSHT
jgi:hypothetical protein